MDEYDEAILFTLSLLESRLSRLEYVLGNTPTPDETPKTVTERIHKLEKALADVTAKCQNIVSLELILESTKPPPHPLFPGPASPHHKVPSLLQPLLAHLETGSLPSYFWRTMASSLAARVQVSALAEGDELLRVRPDRLRLRLGRLDPPVRDQGAGEVRIERLSVRGVATELLA